MQKTTNEELQRKYPQQSIKLQFTPAIIDALAQASRKHDVSISNLIGAVVVVFAANANAATWEMLANVAKTRQTNGE